MVQAERKSKNEIAAFRPFTVQNPANSNRPKLQNRLTFNCLAAVHGRLLIRTIGIARAMTKIGMVNLVYNIKRLLFLRKTALA
jgi:IS5 family transposase